MDDISSRQIAAAFTGSFLGAGFVSGQELMQFFGIFGSYGLLGMVFSILLFCAFGCLVMKIAKKTGAVEFDKVIVEKEIPWLRGIFSGIFLLFLFGVVVIMLAGAGALLHQVLGIPIIIGNALMGMGLGIMALWGAKGVLRAFSITVPLLIVAAVITSLLSYFTFDARVIPVQPFSGANPLLGNWLFSMVAFVSYNMMAAISILVPIATDVKEERTIHRGILQGTGQLIIVFVCLLLPLILNQTMLADSELPMLTLAEGIHPALGMIYAILLFCGMFGSGLSCLFGVTLRIKKFREIPGNKLTLGLVSLAFTGSIAGFKELIAILFPIFGYMGFFGLVGVLLHFISLQRRRSVEKEVEEMME